MGVILLDKLHFKAYHGYYDEERERGNQFELTVTIHTNFERAAETDELHETVDYAEVYAVIKEQMQVPSRLLENVTYRIAVQLLEGFPAIEYVQLTLSKLNAPIGGPCYAATIVYEKTRA